MSKLSISNEATDNDPTLDNITDYQKFVAVIPVFHERTNHLEIELDFVREKILSGVIKTVKVDFVNQIADILTKRLDTFQHKILVEKLGTRYANRSLKIVLLRVIDKASHQIAGLSGRHFCKLIPRHAKWVKFMQFYSFLIKHKAGTLNKVADALSQRHILLSTMQIQIVGVDIFKELYVNDPDLSGIWHKCQVQSYPPYGFFLGKREAYPVVANYVRNTWGKYGLFIRRNPLILKKWNPDVNLLKEEIGNVSVWVKLHGVPVTAFNEDGLSAIVTKIGTPLMLDSYTSNKCIQSWGRSSYVRALIEVRAHVELKDNIAVAMPKLGEEGFYTCNVRVEYEWKTPRCTCCKVFGHVQDECPKNKVSDVVKNMKKPSHTHRGVPVGP
ncbi:hypothetical protein Tco_1059201 [Tanacetum coccineum]